EHLFHRRIMKILAGAVFLLTLLSSHPQAFSRSGKDKDNAQPDANSGFRDLAAEQDIEKRFLAVPDPKLAEEHLRILTQAPHIAGSPEDKATAEYVAKRFREAGLETEIVEYRVWMNYPGEISVDMTAPDGITMHGPSREHIAGDPFQDDPRVVVPYSAMSPSGDVEADGVSVNEGSPEDFHEPVR